MGAADMFDPGQEWCKSGFLHTGLDHRNKADMDKLFTLLLLWRTRELGESAFTSAILYLLIKEWWAFAVQLSQLILENYKREVQTMVV